MGRISESGIPAATTLKGLPPGGRHYRAWVGAPELYDLVGAMQFNLLTSLGLRESHSLLDIGCGSLRAGKLFIPFLRPGHYFGIEPENRVLEEGIRSEVGWELIERKKPRFSNDRNFGCSSFGQDFDFILAQSVFTRASQEQIRRCFTEARLCMKPTSIFVATFLKGDENYMGSGWVYPGTITYALGRMKEIAREAGLILEPLEWPHPASQNWVLIMRDDRELESSISSSPLFTTAQLRTEVQFCRERLSRLVTHPYIRFGFKIQRIVHKVRLALERSLG